MPAHHDCIDTIEGGQEPNGPDPSSLSWSLLAAELFLRRPGHAVRVGLEAVLAVLLTWQQRANERADLEKLDDWALRDMGITPAQANQEAAKPFWRG
jgi:uncharacterized protein YjiS (DUF1127 family)